MAERTAVVPQRQRWHMSHDNLKLSFSGGLPDQVKLIKNLSVYPLVFTAMLSYDLRHQTFGWGFTCIEDFLHGRISFNTAHRAIEYRYAGLACIAAGIWAMHCDGTQIGIWKAAPLSCKLSAACLFLFAALC